MAAFSTAWTVSPMRRRLWCISSATSSTHEPERGRNARRAGEAAGVQEGHRPSRPRTAQSAGRAGVHAWARQGTAQGSSLLVPFNVSVNVGEALYGKASHDAFVASLEKAMTALASEEKVPAWE